MWTCPKCKRSFKNNNQAHGCHQIKVEDLFRKRSDHIRKLYLELDSKISTIGKFRKEAVPPDVVFYKTVSTFLAVKVKTKWLDIEFFLDHYDDNPIVKKYLQTSKKRFVHLVSIDENSDINHQLIGWITQSYKIINSE